MKLKLNNPHLLKKVLDSLNELITEGKFQFSPSGITLMQSDDSGVARVGLLIKAEGFEEYQCLLTTSMRVNIRSFSMIVDHADDEDTIKLTDDSDDILTIVCENEAQQKTVSSQLLIMDIENEQVESEEDYYDAVVTMPAREFAKICKDLSDIGDTVVIHVNEKELKFATGGDVGCSFCTYAASDTVTIDTLKEVELSFDLKHFNLFTKATPLCHTVAIKLSVGRPMVLEYKILEMGYIRFYLPHQKLLACVNFYAPYEVEEDDSDEEGTFVLDKTARFCRRSCRKMKEEMDKWDEVQADFVPDFSKFTSTLKQREIVRNTDVEGYNNNIEWGLLLFRLSESMNKYVDKFEEIYKRMIKIASDTESILDITLGGRQRFNVTEFERDPTEFIRSLYEIANKHRDEYWAKKGLVQACWGSFILIRTDPDYLTIIVTTEIARGKDRAKDMLRRLIRADNFYYEGVDPPA